jgi:hypothetical protein
MDFAVPAQLLEVSNIHMLPFQRKGKYPPMSLLQYITPTVELENFSILTPPLLIDDWNAERGRLRLNCSKYPVFASKLSAIQEFICNSIYVHQRTLNLDRTVELGEVKDQFRKIFEGETLNCFISPYHLFPLYENGERVILDDFNKRLRSGRIIRLILQLNGVSSLSGNVFRIQHQILGAYLITGT